MPQKCFFKIEAKSKITKNPFTILRLTLNTIKLSRIHGETKSIKPLWLVEDLSVYST